MLYNTHIHIFRDRDVPVRFLPLSLVRILSTKPGFRIMARLLNNLNPFSDDDVFNRYLKFINTGRQGSQEKIFNCCREQYPVGSKFVVLPMDMAFMGAGDVRRPYREQLEELAALAKDTEDILPFIHVDPRRKEYMDLLKEAVEQWQFKGVKLYPPLGYFPFDKRLDPVFKYCVLKGLPVVTHCSPYNAVHFKGKKKELKKLLQKSDNPAILLNGSKKELCSQFVNPRNYRSVLDRFPGLKICLAHWGSSYYWEKFFSHPAEKNNWFVIIRDMIAEYPGLYTDISFTLSKKEYFPLLKILLHDQSINNKVLFGSDYYMVETKTEERRFSTDLRAYLGEPLFQKIAFDNPREFLGITS